MVICRLRIERRFNRSGHFGSNYHSLGDFDSRVSPYGIFLSLAGHGRKISAYIADHMSSAAVFYVGAVVNAIALIGILAFVPSMSAAKTLSCRHQLKILRSKTFWLTFSTFIFVFAAIFAGFNYISDFLGRVGL